MVMMKRSGDIEARNKIMWLYLRDFYLEVALTWLLAVAIGTVVVHVPAIPKFLLTTTPGIVLYSLGLVAPFAAHFSSNAVLLILSDVLMAFSAGLSCSLFHLGKIILLTLILMSVVYVTLILHTFWAAARGRDFGFLGPFLMVSLFVLIVFALIQIFIPFGKLVITIYVPLMMIAFSGFIIKCCDPSCETLPNMLGKCLGKIILLTLILMSVVYVTLILHTAARGCDFGFLVPFLMVSLFVLIVFALIQIFIPFGKLVITIYVPLMMIAFSGFIINCCDPSCETLPAMLGKCLGQ